MSRTTRFCSGVACLALAVAIGVACLALLNWPTQRASYLKGAGAIAAPSTLGEPGAITHKSDFDTSLKMEALRLAHQFKPFVPCPRTTKGGNWTQFCSCHEEGGSTADPGYHCFFPIHGHILRISEPMGSFMGAFVARELVEKGGYSSMFGLHLNAGDVVLDVGANLGIVSIIMAKLYPGVRIVSLEANPSTYRFLERNVVMNSVEANIIHMNRALAKKDNQSVQIGACELAGHNGVKSSIMRRPSGKCRTADVTTISFEKILSKFNISTIAFLKMDCEGCEVDALPQIPEGLVAHAVGECHSHYFKSAPKALLQKCVDLLGECHGGRCKTLGHHRPQSP